MLKKLTLLTGFAAGYVLGAKAGTERYRQLQGMVSDLRGKPQVQAATAAVTETVTQAASDLGDKARATVNDAVDSVTGGDKPPKATKASGRAAGPVAGAGPSGSAPGVALSTGAPGATTSSR